MYTILAGVSDNQEHLLLDVPMESNVLLSVLILQVFLSSNDRFFHTHGP